MKLSIITPLYNTEKYIERCIRSVYTNNPLPIDDFELIIINDGSTDGSRHVVEQLQQEYANIQLINKENGGQSTARNIGFELAKGEYIFCLDSDDWIDAKELHKALNYTKEHNLDMLPIYFSGVSEKGEVIERKKDNYEKSRNILTGPEFLNKYIISGTMWRYLYKTDIIIHNNLRLLEGVFHEDEEFVIRFLTHVNRIGYQQHLVYYYLQRSDSTVNKRDEAHRVKLLFDLTRVCDSLTEIIDESTDKLTRKGVRRKLQQIVLVIFIHLYKQNIKSDNKDAIIKRLIEKEHFPLKYNELSYKQKVACFAINVYYKAQYKTTTYHSQIK